MRVVIDTNVLISGLMGLYTYPARVVDLVYVGRFQCIYDDRIIAEYRDVLSRPKFKQVVSEKEQKDLLQYLLYSGTHVLAAPIEVIRRSSAPDPDDLIFADAAVAGEARYLITGNKKHFLFFADNQWGIEILSPRECYHLMCGQDY